jgi:hypothetical protein
MLRLSKNSFLTKNFQLKELCVSKEYPYLVEKLYLTTDKYTDSLFMLCHLLLQPIRSEFDVPMHILSGYRNFELNSKVGGSYNSRHMVGKAADFYIKDRSLLPEVFDWAKERLKGRYGELLLYLNEDKTPNFIHIALPRWGRGVKIEKEVIR